MRKPSSWPGGWPAEASNQVRIHLIDGHYAPLGLFDPEHKGQLCILFEQLDKLDYLIAELKRRGLYVELPVNGYHWRNITGATGFSGMDPKKFSAFSSGIPLWTRRYLATEQQFARDFLTHVNPYTGKSYAEEPAVAFIEIVNENGIICAWRGNHFRKAWPQAMVADLQTHWNKFLQSRYSTTERLRRAWSEGEFRAKPRQTLQNGDFSGGAASWHLQVVKPSVATMQPAADGGPADQPCLVLKSDRAPTGSAFVLLQQGGLTIEKGCLYKLSFHAKADVSSGESVRLGIIVSMNHAPWSNVGLSSSAEVGRAVAGADLLFRR